ncbi:MAG: glutaredoxin domain-containing protein [Anaerolineaceae bacterium]|nr:glutaredoxin domain-containing protein [Anaerolineaceae bacterium]
MENANIIVYGTSWCSDCQFTKRYFESNRIPFTWIDIESDEKARAFVVETNHGFASVPTICFPDGSLLVEPSLNELNRRFKPQ